MEVSYWRLVVKSFTEDSHCRFMLNIEIFVMENIKWKSHTGDS